MEYFLSVFSSNGYGYFLRSVSQNQLSVKNYWQVFKEELSFELLINDLVELVKGLSLTPSSFRTLFKILSVRSTSKKCLFSLLGWLKIFILKRPENFLFIYFSQFLEPVLILNAYATCIDFLSRLCALFWRKQPLRGWSKNKYVQNLDNLFVTCLLVKNRLFSHLASWRSKNVLKIKSFTHVLRTFCLEF